MALHRRYCHVPSSCARCPRPCYLSLSKARSRTTLPRALAAGLDVLSSTEPSYESTSSLDEVEFVDNVLPWVPKTYKRVMAPPNAPPIVILPGFGNCTADYVAPFGNKEASFKTALEARGFKVYVVNVERKNWFQVARAIFTTGFWSSTLTTHPGYTWYLRLVDATVKQALAETGAAQVDLVGHSAGGWLARAYLADTSYFPGGDTLVTTPISSGTSAFARFTAALPSLPPLLLKLPGHSPSADEGGARAASSTVVSTSSGDAVQQLTTAPSGVGEVVELKPNPQIRSIVTLGSPQKAVPLDKGRDVTGGALSWVHQRCPGAFFAPAGVRYVSVCGRTVRGQRLQAGQTRGPRTPPQYAHDSYQQVCGVGQDVEGDAVVPLSCAFLGGSQQVILDGVFHSMSRIGTFEEASGKVWYGSDEVVDAWLWAIAEPLEQTQMSSVTGASLQV